jgi:hypothetical protein
MRTNAGENPLTALCGDKYCDGDVLDFAAKNNAVDAFADYASQHNCSASQRHAPASQRNNASAYLALLQSFPSLLF